MQNIDKSLLKEHMVGRRSNSWTSGIDWMVTPPYKKDMSSGTLHTTLLEYRDFADVIKLMISRWDHPELRWAQEGVIREEERKT